MQIILTPLPDSRKNMDFNSDESVKLMDSRERNAMESGYLFLEQLKQTHVFQWDCQYSRFCGPNWEKYLAETHSPEEIAQTVFAATVFYMRQQAGMPLVTEDEAD